MYIQVNFPDPAERAQLCAMLRTWRELSCVSLDIRAAQKSLVPREPAIVFWDLDGPEEPPAAWQSLEYALFLCSGDPQRAIDSYLFHPTGFLLKPISMEQLWRAMLRCARLWFSSLTRLEVFSDRVRIGIPLKNLIWVEGARRGCLLHTSHQSIPVRDALYQLEQRLPHVIFTRCQRSFVVNLTHVREVAGTSLFLADGTEVSMGRGDKAAVLDAYRRFRRLRYGE